jgi:hypothetical protein
VSSINVAPSVAALTEGLKTVAQAKTPPARPGIENTFSRANLICRAQSGGPFRTFRWFVTENVAVAVATFPDPSLADRVFLQRLATALAEQVPNETPTPTSSPSSSSTTGPGESPVGGDEGTFPTPSPPRKTSRPNRP